MELGKLDISTQNRLLGAYKRLCDVYGDVYEDEIKRLDIWKRGSEWRRTEIRKIMVWARN